MEIVVLIYAQHVQICHGAELQQFLNHVEEDVELIPQELHVNVMLIARIMAIVVKTFVKHAVICQDVRIPNLQKIL